MNLESVMRLDYVNMQWMHPGGRDLTDRIATKTELSKSKKILDIGHGRGTTALYWHEKFNCDITAIDIDPTMQQMANTAMKKKGVNSGRLKFQFGDALNLEFKDNTFDMVLNEGVFVIPDDPLKIAQEMHRVAKPGGYLVFHDIFINERKQDDVAFKQKVNEVYSIQTLTKYDFINIAQSAGFTDIYTEDWSGIQEYNKVTDQGGSKYMFSYKQKTKLVFNLIRDFGIRTTLDLLQQERFATNAIKQKDMGHFLLIGKKGK